MARHYIASQMAQCILVKLYCQEYLQSQMAQLEVIIVHIIPSEETYKTFSLLAEIVPATGTMQSDHHLHCFLAIQSVLLL